VNRWLQNDFIATSYCSIGNKVIFQLRTSFSARNNDYNGNNNKEFSEYKNSG
jgi:hypothetical protein